MARASLGHGQAGGAAAEATARKPPAGSGRGTVPPFPDAPGGQSKHLAQFEAGHVIAVATEGMMSVLASSPCCGDRDAPGRRPPPLGDDLSLPLHVSPLGVPQGLWDALFGKKGTEQF